MPFCPEHPDVALTPKKKGWGCPVCDDVVLTYAELPSPSQAACAPATVEPRDLDALPFPVAHPLAFARAPSLDATLRLGNAIFAAYQAMRLSALLLLADYLADDTVARELAGPIQRLAQPHWGEWSVLLDKLCAFYHGRLTDRPSRTTSFPAIVAAWPIVNATKRDARWQAMLDGLLGLQGAARSANDAIWKLRNDRAHRQSTQTFDRDEDARVLARTLPLVEALVQALFPPGSFTLLRRAPARDAHGAPRAVRLHGAHETLGDFEPFALDPAFLGAFDATQVIAQIGNEVVNVHPLLLPHEEVELAAAPPSGLIEPLLLVDGLVKRGLVALGVRSHGVAGEALATFRAALAHKELELGIGAKEADRWTLADWSRWQALESVGALRGVKYFPECYVERAGVEEVIARRLEQPGRALLVLAEAGGGKSSLLARLAERLARDEDEGERAAQPAKRARGEDGALEAYFASKGRGDVVLFLSGHRDFAGDAGLSSHALLCDAVVQRAGVRGRSFASLEAFVERLAQTAADDARRDRRLWILLDAINEADRFTDLMGALDAFLPCLGRHPWLRLVVSLRSGAYHALKRRNDREARHVAGVLDHERFLHSFLADGAKEPVPYLELAPFAANEVGAAYRLRQERLPDRSSPIAFEALPRSLRAVLASPLHLHLFHETWAGRIDVPADLDDRALRDAYLDHLCAHLPSMRTSLRELGEGMFERREASLPAELAEAWMARWRRSLGAESLERVLKLDPLEELVAASVLMRAGEDGALRFTHQRLCEQVLVRELRRRIAPRTLPTREELLAWARHAAGPELGEHDDFQELVGALATLAEELARAGEGETLAGLLELEDDPARTKILGAALRALGPIWGKSEEGAPVARRCLEGLTRAALGATEAGERWLRSLCALDLPRGGGGVGDHDRVLSWVKSSVALRRGRAGAAITQSRVAVMRWLVNAEPGRHWRQTWLLDTLHHTEIGHFDEYVSLLRRFGALEPYRDDLDVYLFIALYSIARREGRSEDVCRFFFEECLRPGRWPVAADPQLAERQQSVPWYLNWLGNEARREGRSEDARRFFEFSLGISRRLVEAEPRGADLQHGLSVSLDSLGNLARAAGRSEEAREYFEESLGVMRRLVEAEPHRANLQRDLWVSLNHLGNLAEAAGRSEEAREHFEESLDVMRRLVEAEPHRADLQRDLSKQLKGVCGLACAAGQLEHAKMLAEELLAVEHSLFDMESKAMSDRELWASLAGLGKLANAAGRFNEAHGYFEKALGVSRQMVHATPSRAEDQRRLSRSLDDLGSLAASACQFGEARRFLEESLHVKRRLVDADPNGTEDQRQLSASLHDLGTLSFAAGRTEEARQFFAESIGLRRRLVDAAPGKAELQRDLLSSLDYLHMLAEGAGQRDDARRLLQESLVPMRQLVASAAHDVELNRDLAVRLNRVGKHERAAGRSEEAFRLFRESVSVRRRLVDCEPHRANLRVELAGSLWNSYLAASEPSDKRELLESVAATLGPLHDAGLADDRIEALQRKARRALSKL